MQPGSTLTLLAIPAWREAMAAAAGAPDSVEIDPVDATEVG